MYNNNNKVSFITFSSSTKQERYPEGRTASLSCPQSRKSNLRVDDNILIAVVIVFLGRSIEPISLVVELYRLVLAWTVASVQFLISQEITKYVLGKR